MILCIDASKMEKKNELQKDLKLEEVLSNTKYFDTVEEAIKENYVPIDFMVSIRSAYTNLVLQRSVKDSEEKRYYVNMTNVDLLPHKGYDLIMYLASIGLMSCVDYKLGFDDLMMKSQFMPIGLYNPAPEALNPIIYSHVVLADETVEAFKPFLKEECDLVPISEMKKEGNLPAILVSIFEVKEEEKSGTENDNDN